jgi:hypothetical protein
MGGSRPATTTRTSGPSAGNSSFLAVSGPTNSGITN